MELERVKSKIKNNHPSCNSVVNLGNNDELQAQAIENQQQTIHEQNEEIKELLEIAKVKILSSSDTEVVDVKLVGQVFNLYEKKCKQLADAHAKISDLVAKAAVECNIANTENNSTANNTIELREKVDNNKTDVQGDNFDCQVCSGFYLIESRVIFNPCCHGCCKSCGTMLKHCHVCRATIQSVDNQFI